MSVAKTYLMVDLYFPARDASKYNEYMSQV